MARWQEGRELLLRVMVWGTFAYNPAITSFPVEWTENRNNYALRNTQHVTRNTQHVTRNTQHVTRNT